MNLYGFNPSTLNGERRTFELFGSLEIEIWDLLGIWCLEFDISEHPNTRDSISKDDLQFSTKIEFSCPVVAQGHECLVRNNIYPDP